MEVTSVRGQGWDTHRETRPPTESLGWRDRSTPCPQGPSPQRDMSHPRPVVHPGFRDRRRQLEAMKYTSCHLGPKLHPSVHAGPIYPQAGPCHRRGAVCGVHMARKAPEVRRGPGPGRGPQEVAARRM